VSARATDWNPETYARFRGLRLRPALDLLAQIGELPAGEVVDLGCGDGGVAAELARRFPDGDLHGVDSSQAMLAKAGELQLYRSLDRADVGLWLPHAPTALIFSNAALHWLPDHAALLPRLARSLVPGGVLAVQMPRQFFAPSHRFLRDIAATMFADRFDFSHYQPPVATAVEYCEMLAPLGAVNSWETEYIQRLERAEGMHPVRAFTASTAMRPFAEKLTESEYAGFCQAYDTALGSAYPLHVDGSVLFPFRRLFFILRV
jgi:trans-aconitate 2-methyltransferase